MTKPFTATALCWVALLVANWLSQKGSWALLAYDCEHKHSNYTTVGLSAPLECVQEKPRTTTEIPRILVLQRSRYSFTSVRQCLVTVSRLITHCGHNSHASMVESGFGTEIRSLGRDACLDAHKYGQVSISPGQILAGNSVNATSYHRVSLAGSVDSAGYCAGQVYSDGRNTWKNVLVTAEVKVKLREVRGTIDLTSNALKLPGGLTCPLPADRCVDGEEGESYWDYTETGTCSPGRMQLLYDGPATHVQPAGPQSKDYYLASGGNFALAAATVGKTTICGVAALQTEHPSLVLVLEPALDFQFSGSQLEAENVDLTTYLNSKLIYLERHVGRALDDLYSDAMMKKCQDRRLQLQGLVSIAYTDPDEFARQLMGSLGYTAFTMGQIAIITQCQPVEVTIRRTNSCTSELPVTHGSKDLFSNPRTMTLQHFATEVDCDSPVKPMYDISGQWYSVGLHLRESPSPVRLDPNERFGWKYKNLDELAKSGLYTPEDLVRMRARHLYQSERGAVVSTLVASSVNAKISRQGLISPLMDPAHVIEERTKAAVKQALGWLAYFGETASIIVCVWLIIKTILWIASTVITFLTVKRRKGWRSGAKRCWLPALALSELTPNVMSDDETPASPPFKPAELTQHVNYSALLADAPRD